MAKKIWYGKTFALPYKTLRLIEKSAKENGLTDKESIRQYFFNYCGQFSITVDDRTNLDLFRMELDNKIPHLFIETKELKEFLHKTKVKDYGGIKKYISENGTEIINLSNNFCLDKTLVLNVHTPYEKDGYTISYTIVNDVLAIFVAHGELLTHCDSSIFSNEKEFQKQDSDVVRQTNFAINFLYYMICFPEAIIDGVPKMENEEVFDTGKIIKVSEKVVESTASKSITPHFRKGYFKRLESDYFVNKKGQIIFVHETMVKGKAKTVVDTDNKE